MLTPPATPERHLIKQNELTFIWTNKNGHGIGVIMSYIWRKGRIWCTATEQRARMKALARDPRYPSPLMAVLCVI